MPTGGIMRNLILFLIAFIAVVTFIRAYDKTDIGAQDNSRQSIIEVNIRD